MSTLPTALECAWLWASPPLDTFWWWSDDHESIEWDDKTDGERTLLLRAELLAFVRHRVAAGLGLPPLQLVVVLMALLRDRERFARVLPNVDLPATESLWQRVRHAPQLRVHLIDAATWCAKTNSPEFAAQVATALAVELPQDHLAPRDFRALSLAEAVELLRLGLRAVTEERLELWARTGLAELPEPAALPSPPPRDGRELLASLAADPELGGLVGVVRQLQAALRLPSRALRRDEQATDGFVGVGNRGPLDRLLPSELAHDDDVLAVRIATNEALYVQREAPPRRPRARRRILLDDGVRLWGTPRVLGIAVALALQASAPRDLEVEVWRQDDGRLVRIGLGSRDELVQQLARLDRRLDVRTVLPQFWAGDAASPQRADEHDEAIVVAHAASVADPEFVGRAEALRPRQRRHLVTVDEFGACTLVELTPHGAETNARVAVQLPTGWATPPVPSSTATPGRSQLLPQFCRGPRPCASPPKCAQHAAVFVQAIAVCDGRLVVRRRGVPQALVRCGAFVVFDPYAPNGWEQRPWSPFAPLPVVADTPSQEPVAMAELGARWRVFLDRRGFLHFVPRDSDGSDELSIPLVYGGTRLVGWRHGECADRELWAHLERIGKEAV